MKSIVVWVVTWFKDQAISLNSYNATDDWSNFLTNDSYVSLTVDCNVEVIVSAVSSPCL